MSIGTTEVMQEYLVKLGYAVDQVTFKKMFAGLDTTHQKVFKVGAVAASAVVAVESAVAEFAYSMRRMYFAAELSGTTVKNMNAMAYAGKQVGISGDSMGSAIHSMAQALRLNPGLNGLLKSLGVKVEGRNIDDVMVDLVEATKSMPEYVGQQYASMFGIDPDTYHQMLSHLDELKKKKQENLDLYAQYGIDIDAQKKTMLEYTSGLDKLESQLKALGIAMMVGLEPAFKWLNGKLLEATDWWTHYFMSMDPKYQAEQKKLKEDLAKQGVHLTPTAQKRIQSMELNDQVPGGEDFGNAIMEATQSKPKDDLSQFDKDFKTPPKSIPPVVAKTPTVPVPVAPQPVVPTQPLFTPPPKKIPPAVLAPEQILTSRTAKIPSAPGVTPPTTLGDTDFGKLIARGEGDYNSVNTGKAHGYQSSHVDLSKMTVREVLAAQNNKDFQAAGRYQMVPKTLEAGIRDAGISPDAKFDKSTQDQLFQKYLAGSKRPAIRDYLNGKSNDLHAALKEVAQEWASVADPDTGKSYHEGKGNNKASITSQEMSIALNQTRMQMATNPEIAKTPPGTEKKPAPIPTIGLTDKKPSVAPNTASVGLPAAIPQAPLAPVVPNTKLGAENVTNNRSVTFNNKTEINVAAGTPKEVVKDISDNQDRLYGNALRDLAGAMI